LYTATFEHFWPLRGHFTATHCYKFSTANQFLKLPHLRKVAVMAATWQPWPVPVPGTGNSQWPLAFFPPNLVPAFLMSLWTLPLLRFAVHLILHVKCLHFTVQLPFFITFLYYFVSSDGLTIVMEPCWISVIVTRIGVPVFCCLP
jgi:hypothetical protein